MLRTLYNTRKHTTHIHTHQNITCKAQHICQDRILYTFDGWCDADCAALQLLCTGCADQLTQPDAGLVMTHRQAQSMVENESSCGFNIKPSHESSHTSSYQSSLQACTYVCGCTDQGHQICDVMHTAWAARSLSSSSGATKYGAPLFERMSHLSACALEMSSFRT